MKARTLAVLLFAAVASQASMAGQQTTLQSIAAESRLSVREVRMVLSRGPASYSEYRTSYFRAKNQLLRSVGQARFAELAALYQDGQIPLGSS